MKKAFDQTVRELKREVNKKVLKVPGVEQKILDATSNELWGPHGSLLADIAQATRNYHEYQIIMHVIWKRLNDTGKNWRHVYKSLTVLEYLVGHGSERVIDEIKEHAYQISTLSEFQYIDSSGKDQGNNVRRKSQALVSLINDKEKIQEVRQKALTNKDKYRPAFSSGGSYKPGSYSSTGGYGDRYDDDPYDGRYGSKDDDRNGYERERNLAYRDDDRYAKGGESYRDGDDYAKDSDEHPGRGSYKNDDNRGGRVNDDYQFGPRSRSFDKDRDHSYEEDDSYSYRAGRANDTSPDERHIQLRLSEQSVGPPPNHESAIKNDNNNMQDEGDGGVGMANSRTFLSAAPKASSPQSTSHGQQHSVAGVHLSTLNMDDTSFDEFDPRGFTSSVNSTPWAAGHTSPAPSGSVVDFFSSSSSLDPADSLALVLAAPTLAASDTEMVTNLGSGMNFVALSSGTVALSQPTEDPFGDVPFKAIKHEDVPNHKQDSVPVASIAASFPSSTISLSTSEPVSTVSPILETTSMDFGFGDSLSGLTYVPNAPQYPAHPTVPASETLAQPNLDALRTHLGQSNLQTTNTLYTHTSFPVSGLSIVPSHAAQAFASINAQTTDTGFLLPLGLSIPQSVPLTTMQSVQPVSQLNVLPSATQQTSTNISAPANTKQSNVAFETKSSVWADTLNRGIVNLNISGAKTNPLADIGVDFDSINRLERRKEKEKSSANPMTSTVAMGKAMGSGSGIGRSGAAAYGQTTRPIMGPGMGMGMGIVMGGGGPALGGPSGMGTGIGAYGGTMNQAMGMNMGMNTGMNMSMGMSQGGSVRPLPDMQSSRAFPGSGYNNSMEMGGYGSNQPYGSGYR